MVHWSVCLSFTFRNAAPEANNRLVDRAYTEKWLVSAKSSPEEDAAFAMRLKASRAHIERYADGRTESQWSRFAAREIPSKNVVKAICGLGCLLSWVGESERSVFSV